MQTYANSTSSNPGTGAWNGGICPTCFAVYVGSHACTRESIDARIAMLQALRDSLPTGTTQRTMGCPCRSENGGSGVCGCILGGPSVS